MGCCSSVPPGSRTSGELDGASSDSAAARPRLSGRQVKGSRLRAGEVEHPHRRLGRTRADDLEADPLDALQRLAAGDEGREEEVAERSVVEQERAQRVAVDRDVAQRLRHDRGEEDGLTGEEVQLAEEARGAVPDDLVAGRVEDRDLAFDGSR